jgi:predicted DNA-binding transcriptional regulator AlpA
MSQDKLYDTDAAASYLDCSVMMLHKLRMKGGGPRYVKLGTKMVRYTRHDLDAWVEQCGRASTSQAAPRAKAVA